MAGVRLAFCIWRRDYLDRGHSGKTIRPRFWWTLPRFSRHFSSQRHARRKARTRKEAARRNAGNDPRPPGGRIGRARRSDGQRWFGVFRVGRLETTPALAPCTGSCRGARCLVRRRLSNLARTHIPLSAQRRIWLREQVILNEKFRLTAQPRRSLFVGLSGVDTIAATCLAAGILS